MQPVVLDTDIVSLSHKRRLSRPVATRLIGRRPLITFVTFGELTKWTDPRDWGSRRRRELADWLSGIPVLPGDEAVAATWGVLSAAATRAGQPRPVNDMWIAACCLTHNLPLATLNPKDCMYFRDHRGLRILGEE
ncbi:type II toxin-antitoxin system VapC family toxin [Frankia sp. B2]|uniref:type II toxin-antitoxin system VapC family toxin n=1 Tax=unclassified Frankia TaxID=2632575 RepID=UPI000460E7A2|nr:MULTISPECIES: type II toxin-antitoxin system VapC family toxin [unclassified Frankia]KDA43027.1 putative nucleic acid-binding protein, contains PIN domain [Frankia sp. BMG5.23]KEZ36486.1 putative nucleic acid-binding protein, contains PIN domain [Frankia sp. CeD]TFE29767.1 type II toxin-antitoxin system VapC family toxin [Frankia sp. B2]